MKEVGFKIFFVLLIGRISIGEEKLYLLSIVGGFIFKVGFILGRVWRGDRE